MFYLIGGAPRSGKTTLAKQLSKKLELPWISTDTLESVVAQYVPEKELPILFPKSVIRKETAQSNDEMYKQYSAQEIVDAYIEQSKALIDAIKIFLESESKYNHSYILEGYHITPTLVNKLQQKISIQAVFIGREDVTDTLKSIKQSTDSSDWVIEKTKSEDTFHKIAEMIVLFSTTLKTNAKKYKQEYYSVDGDFEANLKEILEHLV